MGMKRTTQKNKETELVLQEDKKNKKILAKLIKREKKKTQMNKIRDEKRKITTNADVVQRITEVYFGTNIQVFWKDWKKWMINFYTSMTYQNEINRYK